MATCKQVCVIGCGSSGMPVVKALADRDISFDCFERSNEIGGNWTINNQNGMSAAYESLRINTARDMMAYADMPMDDSYPVYPEHRQIKCYFEAYMDAFDLHQHVRFNTTVEHCEKLASGRWRVSLDDGSEHEYEQLIVANGHHWDPRWPDPAIPGHFDGLVMHSHAYQSPSEPFDFSGKRIGIVGFGNSALDIACELSQPVLENEITLVVRRSTWVLPRFLFGKPVGWKIKYFSPWRLISPLMETMLRISVGSPQSHGLPKPEHRALQAHPTISQHIFDKLDAGEIKVRGEITELLGSKVRCKDGVEEELDVLIYATGYKLSLPFFDPKFISAPNNELPLWQRMVKPGVDNLFFVGLMQPLGAVMPLAEKQAKLIADVIAGTLKLPPSHEMIDDMLDEQIALRDRYRDSPRHTMQVDGPEYDRLLDRVRKRGEREAIHPAPVLNAG